MGAFDKVAVSTAERLEKHVGPEAALAAYRPLLTRLSGGEPRTRAALGALRCAEQLGDATAIAEIAAVWSTLRDARPGDAIPTLVRALVTRGLDRAAAALASAEAARAPMARSLYLAARCRERVGDAEAMSLYLRAADRAEGPDAAIGAAARARRIERLAADPACAKEALEEALAAPLEAATRAQKLAIAGVRLRAPSPFARASALSSLEELGRPRRDGSSPLDAIARAAILSAARHADVRGDALAPVEEDRIVAALRHWPDANTREAAIARVHALAAIARATGAARDDAAARAAVLDPKRVPILASAHAVLAGGLAGQGIVAGASIGLRLGASALDAMAALLRDRDDDASAALRRCASLLASATSSPPALALAIEHGLARVPTRAAAAEVMEALFDARLGFPSRGHAQLAAALRVAKREDLAVRVLRAGAAARDPEAIDDLMTDRVREAHRALASGDRDAAIAALREARAVSAKR